jgi:hypothetical protein
VSRVLRLNSGSVRVNVSYMCAVCFEYAVLTEPNAFRIFRLCAVGLPIGRTCIYSDIFIYICKEKINIRTHHIYNDKSVHMFVSESWQPRRHEVASQDPSSPGGMTLHRRIQGRGYICSSVGKCVRSQCVSMCVYNICILYRVLCRKVWV